MKNEIIIFEEDEIKLEVNLQDETVWLSQLQMAELFQKGRSTITWHINNIFKDGELEEEVVCQEFRHTTQHGAITNKQQTVTTILYSLDMILSVGYRVKSKRGISFRRWSSKILKEHLIKGYTENKPRLDYLEKTVKVKVKFK